MSTEEFSNGFDILVDSYRRFKDFDDRMLLDTIEYSEYEKSVYLTKAQEALVQEVYSGKYTADSFERTEEVRRQLDALVQQVAFSKDTKSNHLSDKFKHKTYSLPDDCWYIIYEQVKWSSDAGECVADGIADIVPVTHDEYQRTINNPFRGPNKRRVLRLDIGKLEVELVSSYNVGTYTIRYVKRPEPIVLCDLEADGLNINGVTSPQTCQLSDLVHQEILSRAVTMALSHRLNNTNKDNASK